MPYSREGCYWPASNASIDHEKSLIAEGLSEEEVEERMFQWVDLESELLSVAIAEAQETAGKPNNR